MSQLLIGQYLNQLSDLKRVSGSLRESVVREAFKDLLKGYARQHHLVFVAEYQIESPAKERRYVDGALLHELRVPLGYWEAKDEKDDLDAEIEFKFKRGYPQDNIVFEDSREAVLIQNRNEVMRCAVDDVQKLQRLLDLFFGYERKEIVDFAKAVAQFKHDLPEVLKALRQRIEKSLVENQGFRDAAAAFLTHAQEAINPTLGEADVREMLIQHILTEEIFSKVFGEDDFHRQNNVARELYALESTFFTGDVKKRTLRGLDAYYSAIRAAAARVDRHRDKQTFLKLIYENFYKVYNAKAADRLGVVYTPNEIVRFMIEGADWLCEKHFGRNLIDKDVEILDPATGTGTFICELLEHFRGQPKKLAHKYREELHANEVAILPYYVANLNIEATYAAIMGEYEEFKNLCFVDTLDNVGLHTAAHGQTIDMFGSVSEENVARIKRQNAKKISVIIGNPPYNANQANENDNNKNREYPSIDARIKQTYIAESTAQKTKLYDMYARFFRWASDRLDANGVLAFVTNRSFIDSRTFDGFRKVVTQEFAEVYVVDLGGDVRANSKLSGTKNNVFGIQTGVAISFLVKRHGATAKKGCRVFYARRPEMETAEEKLAFMSSARASAMTFEEVRPDAKQNWVNLTSNNFDELMPVATKASKAASESHLKEKVIFKMFSLGVVTARDEWVYADDIDALEMKVRSLIDQYNGDVRRLSSVLDRETLASKLDASIKWSRAVKNDLKKGVHYTFDRSLIRETLYRPFVKSYLYFDKRINEVQYQLPSIFRGQPNPTITFLCVDSSNPLAALAVPLPFDYCLLKKGNGGTQSLPFWFYDDAGVRQSNITDWSLRQFQQHYQPGRGKKAQPITKEDLFHYVYAVLHDPVYREKYAINLKREFPRIPFYGDSESAFRQWAAWGAELMTMHIGYETVEPFALSRADTPDTRAIAAGQSPKCILKSDPESGRIVIDSETVLAGIPREAWDYRLGNRSAIDWVLDQHKEKKPKDPTIREKFNTYRFADYKEKVIDLLARVTTVSVKTVRIVEAMRGASR